MSLVKVQLAAMAKGDFFAPQLKALTLTVGKGSRSNRIMREIIIRHLLALRFMNPQAVVSLVETHRAGTAKVSYEMSDGRRLGFDLKGYADPDVVVAKILLSGKGALRRLSTGDGFPSYVLQAPATAVTTLANGVRVASEDAHGETATVGVYIDAGSRYETTANNGAAHFLEHMIFKGTKKRTQTQLELEFENMGGHLNAYTSREMTVYYAKVFKNDVPKAIDLLSDSLLNSRLDESAIERERGVILREMEEVNRQWEEVIFDRLHETAYQDQGLGRTILGPEENIRSITRDTLTEYINTHYTGPRVVVAGAGAVEHGALVELADAAFGGLPRSPPPGVIVPNEKAVFCGADYRLREDDIPLAHVAVAFEGAGWTSPHAFPLMIIQTLLGQFDRTSGSGSNLASKLCQVAGELELAHTFMAFNTCYKDTGLLGVYAVTEPMKVEDLMFHVMECIVRLCHEVSEEEVARARTQLKTTLLAQLDGSTAVCEDIGRQMLVLGRRMTPAELFARIDAVDAASVKATALHFIDDRDVAVAAVGSIHELPDYNWIRRRSYWLRY